MTRARRPLGNIDQILQLGFKDQPDGKPDVAHAAAFPGAAVQHVLLRDPSEYDFKWNGDATYVALHDLRLRDGEMAVDGKKVPRILDLRDRLTVLPAQCEVNGWSQLAKRTNQFTVLYIDPLLAENELEEARAKPVKPMVHFENNDLRFTLEKLRSLLKNPDPSDHVYAENLAMVAALEVYRLQNGGAPRPIADRGQLTASQERLIREAIAENAGRNLSLGELAALTKLSRFHFARAFKKTFGMPPHQFILHSRIEAAKVALVKDDIGLADLARSLGFGSQSRFSEVFRKSTGLSPAQYRRRNK